LAGKLATEVQAAAGTRKWSGTFEISGEAKKAHSEEVDSHLCGMETLKGEDCAENLQKVENDSWGRLAQLNAGSVRTGLQAARDVRSVNKTRRLSNVEAVTAFEVERFAENQTWITASQPAG